MGLTMVAWSPDVESKNCDEFELLDDEFMHSIENRSASSLQQMLEAFFDGLNILNTESICISQPIFDVTNIDVSGLSAHEIVLTVTVGWHIAVCPVAGLNFPENWIEEGTDSLLFLNITHCILIEAGFQEDVKKLELFLINLKTVSRVAFTIGMPVEPNIFGSWRMCGRESSSSRRFLVNSL